MKGNFLFNIIDGIIDGQFCHEQLRRFFVNSAGEDNSEEIEQAQSVESNDADNDSEIVLQGECSFLIFNLVFYQYLLLTYVHVFYLSFFLNFVYYMYFCIIYF